MRISSVVLFAVFTLGAVGCRQMAKPSFDDPYDLNRSDCRIGVLADCDSEFLSRKIYNKAEIVPFEHLRPAVWQLMSEKIDGLVFDEHVLRLIQWKYPERFRLLERPIDTDPSVIAVNASRPELRDRLNRFIAEIRANGVYDDMFLRWCHDPERRPEDVPDLTKLGCNDQKAPVLRIGVDPVQEPNAYFDKQGRLVGYDIEFAYRFARAAGFQVRFVEDEEEVLLGNLESGELDLVIANLGKEPERKKILWSDGYLDSDVVMMVKEK